MIDNWYLSPYDVINCEFNTLKFLKNNSFLHKVGLSSLAIDAYSYHSAHYKRFKERKNIGFDFESTFDIKIGGKVDSAVYVGAIFRLNDSCEFQDISYYVAICEKKNPKPRLLRKYHFDYAPPGAAHRQPHPVFHLQYGGELTPKLKSKSIDDKDLYPWLSEPRLCYFPMSLALLINLILKEFPNEKNGKLVESSEWRGLIRKNEELILKPFFEECCAFLSKGNKKNLFINDFYYGN